MTTLVRKPPSPPSYVIDEAEIAARCLLSPAEWKATATVLERTGFPKVHPVLGKRLRARVDAWFLTDAGVTVVNPVGSLVPDGEETWDRPAPARRRA